MPLGSGLRGTPRSLTETTVNAYCLPYSSCPLLIVRLGSVVSPIGALPPSEIAVTV